MSDPRENPEAVAFGAELLPYQVRLDLNTDPTFVKKYGKKVKEVGGSYDAARGQISHRFVYLPIAAESLINDVWREFGSWDHTSKKTGEKMGTMVATIPGGYNNLPAWVTVHNVSLVDPDPAYALRCKLALALLSARKQGLATDLAVTQAEKDAHEAKLQADKQKLLGERSAEATAALCALGELLSTSEGRSKLYNATLELTLGGALTRLVTEASK